MPRAFGSLATANLLLVLLTAGLGFLDRAQGHDRHVLLAVLTLIFSCAVQVLAFTYLTVTGKVIAHTVHFRRVDRHVLDEAKVIKRSLTRWLATVVVSVVLVVASGAAAWRGQGTAYHWTSAMIAFATHATALAAQFGLIVRNADLLHATLADRTRAADDGEPGTIARFGRPHGGDESAGGVGPVRGGSSDQDRTG